MWTMGHGLVLTQFWAGESISAIPRGHRARFVIQSMYTGYRAPNVTIDLHHFAKMSLPPAHFSRGDRLKFAFALRLALSLAPKLFDFTLDEI